MRCMKTTPSPPEWVRPQEAAAAAGVALRALYDLVDQGHVAGRLASRRLLVCRADAEAWARRGAAEAGPSGA